MVAPLSFAVGIHGHDVPQARSEPTGPELSSDPTSELLAILVGRQLAGVEAKRIMPDPPSAPILVEHKELPGSVLSWRRFSDRTFGAPHPELFTSNRTPTGPPTT